MGDGPIIFTTVSCIYVFFFLGGGGGVQDNIQHNHFLFDVVFQSRSWFLKREKFKTVPLYSLVTKNQAFVWNIEEDMKTFVMMLWRPFWFFMIHVVMSLEVSCVYRIPWYRKHVVWWNKLVSIPIIDKYMLTSVIFMAAILNFAW